MRVSGLGTIHSVAGHVHGQVRCPSPQLRFLSPFLSSLALFFLFSFLFLVLAFALSLLFVDTDESRGHIVVPSHENSNAAEALMVSKSTGR